jgi:hypothetical protein
MAEIARAPLAGRDKPGRSLQPMIQGASGLSPAVLRNTAVVKGRAAFPTFRPVALNNSTAGVKARLSGVPLTPREPFARAAAAIQPDGE